MNNDLGLTWLEQVFDRYTKAKARRKWRLLIIDGHGSHVTKDFIEYCDTHKILLMIFPPHATHTLQPLDVVCFKPLAQNYTKELDLHNHTTQRWVPVKKSDFFSLFWPAWVNTFTKSLVLITFEATGINPPTQTPEHQLFQVSERSIFIDFSSKYDSNAFVNLFPDVLSPLQALWPARCPILSFSSSLS